MTYQNDPNSRNIRRSSRPQDDGTSYMGWIIGAALVLALIVGVFAYNRADRTNTAANPAASSTVTSSSPNVATPPSRETTGAGTSTTPAPSTPSAPAR